MFDTCSERDEGFTILSLIYFNCTFNNPVKVGFSLGYIKYY